jgi:hypothetical protein
LNHSLGGSITEKDRPILGYLTNIQIELHGEEKGEGYDLIFEFSPNSYFEGTTIRKELIMKSRGILDKTVSTKIAWKASCDPTFEKKKKKKKGKKVTVEVKCPSFFNIFENIDPETAEKNSEKSDPKDEEEDDEEDEINEKLQADLDTAD